MKRVNCILNNDVYKRYIFEIAKIEAERMFCRHTLEHFLDVARIAHIINLEENLKIDKELIYAAALLHDIGRLKEYKFGIPHHSASCEMAGELLIASGFIEEECKIILDAIKCHRDPDINNNKSLGELLKRSDKLSRNCFGCKAKADCKWSEDKKNNNLYY